MKDEELKNFNDGFLPPPSIKEEPRQFMLGAISFEKRLDDGYWRKYRSKFEDQNHGGVDKMNCVSESCTNVIEEQINWMIETGQIETEPIKDWLDENGKFETSQRFLAKMSNTSKSGNTQMAVGDALDDYGIPPEKMWPTPPASQYMSWDEYYKTIPAEVKVKALEFNKYFSTRYERLGSVTKTALIQHKQQAPLWIATATCNGWSYQDIIQPCSMTPNHATTCDGHKVNVYWDDLDHYKPYEKKLDWNYKIYYPYKLVVTPLPSILKKNEEQEETMKLYKANNQGSKVFILGEGDNLYHHLDLADDSEAKGILGQNYGALIVQLEEIADTQIGASLTTKKKVFNRIAEFFLTFRGKLNSNK